MVVVPFYNPTIRAQGFQLLHDLHQKISLAAVWGMNCWVQESPQGDCIGK